LNEITKERIATKVVEAINKTDLRHVQIALRLGIEVINYISMIKRPNQYNKIPAYAWEKFRDFVNSGETIESYDLQKYNELKAKKIEKDESIIPESELYIQRPGEIFIKPETKVEVKNGKYTLTIDLILTLNGKRIEVAK